MVTVEGRWVWRRWQLIGVDDTVVDVVDLTDGARGEPLQLITIELRAVEGSGIPAEWVVDTFRRWVHEGDGMCDVFFDERPSDELIALLHGSDVLIAVVSAR
jgi:hypothetical protein